MKLRRATVKDAPHIFSLIDKYFRKGLLLKRPIMTIYENIQGFFVAELDGQLLGTGWIHVLWSDLAEIRALAVRPDATNQGIGKAILNCLINEACDLELSRIFALTYQRGFFEKNGFDVVDKETLPQKVWRECIYCDKFFNCDEVAVIFNLKAPAIPEREFISPDIPKWVVK